METTYTFGNADIIPIANDYHNCCNSGSLLPNVLFMLVLHHDLIS
jgi:hypothetical protein